MWIDNPDVEYLDDVCFSDIIDEKSKLLECRYDSDRERWYIGINLHDLKQDITLNENRHEVSDVSSDDYGINESEIDLDELKEKIDTTKSNIEKFLGKADIKLKLITGTRMC